MTHSRSEMSNPSRVCLFGPPVWGVPGVTCTMHMYTTSLVYDMKCGIHTYIVICSPEIRLRYQNMTHWQHSQSTQLLWGVEYNWRETAWHLWIETNLDTCLYLWWRGITWSHVVDHMIIPYSHTSPTDPTTPWCLLLTLWSMSLILSVLCSTC